MAATTALVIGAGTSIYSAIDTNQRRQAAKGAAAADITATKADQAAAAQKANAAALQARTAQRRRTAAASGRSDTILTGPSGAFLPPLQRKTLLGE